MVHSTPVHNEAWLAYLASNGLHTDLATVEAAMLGRHNADIVRAFFGNALSEDEIIRHGAAKEVIYRDLMRPRLEGFLVPGVLEFCRSHQEVPIGLASNAEPAECPIHFGRRWPAALPQVCHGCSSSFAAQTGS